jgi:hypothetical protein
MAATLSVGDVLGIYDILVKDFAESADPSHPPVSAILDCLSQQCIGSSPPTMGERSMSILLTRPHERTGSGEERDG